MNLEFAALIFILAVVIIARYLLFRETRRKFRKRHQKALQEQETFLKTFGATSFDDFSSFDFGLGDFSHVSPFPRRVKGRWRYEIHLSRSEAEDVATITHEIAECTLGRVIEELLNLGKPLYLQRKEDDKFWVQGKQQKYLVEHVMITLGEVGDVPLERLRERLNKEDAKAWLNLET